jgi:hypothetical protein
MGKMNREEQMEAFSKREVSITEFPTGIYHIRLIMDDHTEVIRIIKTR